jgi:hypothetical protein
MKKAKSKPVSLYPVVIDRIESRRGNLPFSARLTQDLETYWRSMDIGMTSVKQKLTEEDLFAVQASLMSTYWDAGTISVMLRGGVIADVEDTPEAPAGLVDKLRTLTDLENLALLDWLKCGDKK